MLSRLFTETLSALCSSGVRFVVVGGFAAVLQGVGRSTADLDLVIDLSETNARAIVDILIAQGFSCRLPIDPHEFAEAGKREQWIKEKNLQVFSFYHAKFPAFAVDLFVDPPIPHADLSCRAVHRRVGTLTVPVAAIEDLIAMKRIAGRSRDLEDIVALKAIQERQSI